MSDQIAEGSPTPSKSEKVEETNNVDEEQPEMTAEEKKFLITALWESLIVQKWTKDTLIDFGKAIFSKKKFKDMSDKEFERSYPFTKNIAVELGKKLVQKKSEVAKTETKTEVEEAADVKASK
jgi:hypothetical protein